ncbi:hypothetical protein M1293_00520 [Candidatus Parvarchaeota archaeon]|nr:hypothetical protein [Candidatus Parvarchaeota archaeon]
MRRNDLSSRKGSTTIETIVIVIIVVAFSVLVILIAVFVYHMSLPLSSPVPSLSQSPAKCQITPYNISTSSAPNEFAISAYDGSLGVLYNVYMIYSGVTSKIGNYTVGINTFNKTLTLQSGTTEFLCNTTGISPSSGKYTYGPGGEFIITIKD